jgi:hypothetical protein
MGTTADKLAKVLESKNAIKIALQSKGVDIDSDTPFSSYVDKIAEIDSGNTGSYIKAYYDGEVVKDKKVFLTKAGYQLSGSENLSPNPQLSFVTEDGWAGSVSSTYTFSLFLVSYYKYDIINGGVDLSTYKRFDKSDGAAQSSYQVVLPHYFYNGRIFCEIPSEYYPRTPYEATTVLYSYDACRCFYYGVRGNESYYLESCIVSQDSNRFYLCMVSEDVMSTYRTETSFGGNRFWFENENNELIIIYEEADGWKKSIVSVVDGVIQISDGEPVTVNNYTNTASNLYYQIKDFTSPILRLVSPRHYIEYNRETNEITFKNYSSDDISFQPLMQAIENVGVYKMQVYYDGTFSFDMNDGYTYFCEFSEETGELTLICVINPFVVSGDDFVYHRTYTNTRMYWYFRTGVLDSSSRKKYPPSGSYHIGTFNALASETNWLAFDFSSTRFNSTVNMGYLTGDVEIVNGRQVVLIDVPSKIKEEIEKEESITFDDYTHNIQENEDSVIVRLDAYTGTEPVVRCIRLKKEIV